MAKLIYAANTSLDGYLEDDTGGFDWARPDPELHAFFNDLLRPVGTFVYGRRLYETMAVWQTIGVEPPDAETSEAPLPPTVLDFAEVWRAADKVVYSTTLDAVSTPRSRLERAFKPEALQALKDTATSDLLIGGPTFARHAFAADLVDEIHLVVHPVTVGGGKPALPDGTRLLLDLVEEYRFGSDAVHLHYRVTPSG